MTRAAIRDLLVRGRINATSVMVVAPSFHRAEALALQALNTTARHVAIGLHVTLTTPFRPLSDGFRLGWEDLLHGGDADFNDLVLTARVLRQQTR